jgi:hypothetical protein
VIFDFVLFGFVSGLTRRANSSKAARNCFVRQGLAPSLTHTMTSSPSACCHHAVGGSIADFAAEGSVRMRPISNSVRPSAWRRLIRSKRPYVLGRITLRCGYSLLDRSAGRVQFMVRAGRPNYFGKVGKNHRESLTASKRSNDSVTVPSAKEWCFKVCHRGSLQPTYVLAAFADQDDYERRPHLLFAGNSAAETSRKR